MIFLLCEKWNKEQQSVCFGLTVGASCYQWQNETVDKAVNHQLGHSVIDYYLVVKGDSSRWKTGNPVEVKE